MNELHGFVSGEVQGVGFRATARKLAFAYHLRGFVKNLEDGRVEFLVQGPNLKQFLQSLQKHFPSVQFDLTWRNETKAFSSFEVL